MNRYEKIKNLINSLNPIPENIPKIYFLGDTGGGKTTIIRKILDTDEYKFPTTRQRRTTVATTEYVLSNNLPFRATILLKTENEIRGYINEIVQEGTYKLLNEDEPFAGTQIKHFRQTSDQRFRLYYILSEDELKEIVKLLKNLIPDIKGKFIELQKAFPDRSDERDIFEWVFSENKNFDEVQDMIFQKINNAVKEVCNSIDINVEKIIITNFPMKNENLLKNAKNYWLVKKILYPRL